jgi:aspartokinase
VQVVASSQGASDCNICFVVAREKMQKMVDVLHKEFHLQRPAQKN